MAPPTLYWSSATPGSRTVLMTVKSLNLEVNTKPINIMKGETRTPEFIKMNPQHSVPTLDDNGYILWESYAIAPYLVDKYGKDDFLYPKDVQKRSTINQRLHFASSLLYPRYGKLVTASFHKTQPEQKDWDAVYEAYDFLERFLENGYIYGNSLTIADFAIITIMETAVLVEKIDAGKWPKIADWMKRMESLPYFSESNKEGLGKMKEFFAAK